VSRGHDAGRRRFLKVFGTATGALVVGLPAFAYSPDEFLGVPLAQLNTYVRIEPDGTMLIGARDPEVGQGIRTAEARILADELDADWSKVTVAPLDLGVETVNGAPHWTLGHQLASGSTSIPAAWTDLRAVGAAARELLVRAAAERWSVPARTLRTERGAVLAADGRRLDYGELAAAAAALKPPSNPPAPKLPSQFQLIGRDAGDVDARDIVTGLQRYALDEWFGDTLVAVIARCPYPGGSLVHLDDHAARAMRGVENVLLLPTPNPAVPLGTRPLAAGVAVLAKDTWTALRAVASLDVRWRPGAAAAHGDDALAAGAEQAFDGAPTRPVRSDGDFAQAYKSARYRFDAEYRTATIAHAELEPPNALVNLDSARAVIVAPLQNPREALGVVAGLTGLAAGRIEVKLPRVGGAFGRFLENDHVAEAVMLAKTAAKPVKVIWTRGDAFANDTYRPFTLHKLSACADRHHHVTGWSHRIASTSRLAGREPRARWWLTEMHPDDPPAGMVDNLVYDWFALDSPLPRGNYRASAHGVNAFATQGFIDEIANAMKQDPLKLRLDLLGAPRKLSYRGHGGPTLDTGRLSNVLQLAASAIGWNHPPRNGHGLGLACHFTFGGYVAHALEVSMPRNRLIIHRAVCAADIGRVINPLGARAALTSATLDGFSIALHPAITVEQGRIAQAGFRDYQLATMAQLPHEVETILVPSQESPAGAWEMGFPSAAPALVNAIFAATTVRVRQLPIWPQLVRLI
jgi:isoquinoline 1-oxidoreductase subunit beta